MFKILFTILFIFYSKYVLSLEITVKIENWLNDIPETYTVHSDEYIFLENKINSVLSDVLEEETSFNAVRSGPKGQQTSLFTRGTNSNHTLITINGSAITDNSTSNGLSDLGVIDTTFANQLHLIDGPMSTLYGANAVGGVIDIQTEKAVNNKLKTSIGTQGEKKISLMNSFGDNKQFNLGLLVDQTEGISVYPDGNEKDGYDLSGLNLSYNGKYNSSDYKILFIRNHQESDLDASGADDLDYEGTTKFNFFQFNSNTNLNIGKLNIILDTNSWDREYKNGSEIDNYYSQAINYQSVIVTNKEKINNAIGFDYKFYKADFENRGSYNSSVDKDGEQFGLFNNADLKIGKLILSAGYRIDENSHFGNQSTYRIGSAYKYNNITLFNSYATGYKNPTFYEMFGADNFGYKGNPNLKPEIAYSTEAGINFKNNLINSEATIFDTKIKDMITYGNSTYSNDLDDSSTMQGFNLDLNLKIKSFDFKNSYSHLHAVNSTGTWLKRRPHDMLYSSLTFRGKDWSFGGSLSFYGEHADTHSSNYSTIIMKERSIFNLKYTFGNLTFNLNNIFDDTYQRPHGYNQGGRNAKLQYWLYF